MLIPLISLTITQAVKVAIDLRHRHPASMISYGGMPSAHSALFASLVMMAWFTEGLASYAFALSLFLFLTIIRDAAGIRQHLGRHGQILKDLLQEHAQDHQHTIAHDAIVTRLGHTPLQITIGTICGVVITSLLYWLVN